VKEWKYFFAQHRGALAAALLFFVMFTIYAVNHPAGLTPNVVQTAANKGVLLALVAIGQTFVVLTAGIDLSVGMVFVLCNCVASYVVAGSPTMVAFGIAAVLATGLFCGAANGAIVIFGRLQPIVATIASGAVYFGLALWLRRSPGASPKFSSDLADVMTGKVLGIVPSSGIFLAAIVLCVWIPFRRSLLGRAVYATGSSEPSAYMSGVPVKRAKFAAYMFSGFFSALGGLFLTFFTYSGEASSANGSTYTLYSIAAVVLGGVSLFGGRGSAIGAVFGALAFRAIGDLLFVFDVDPLWQPLFQGTVLLLAVSVGSARLLGVRNKLELFS